VESEGPVDVRRANLRLVRIVLGVVIAALLAFGMTYLSLWTYYPHPLAHPLIFAAAAIFYFAADIGIYLASGLFLAGYFRR
jgi:ABC-type glucose/galactose transport system permease subunit